ncbi:hypothetical protein EON64_01930 [archaeon]|nr:MAG: hypothetical protein EON64_01930 [archaeon]
MLPYRLIKKDWSTDPKEDGEASKSTTVTSSTTASSSPAETPSGSIVGRGAVEGLGAISPRTIKKVMNAEAATDTNYYIKEEGSKGIYIAS